MNEKFAIAPHACTNSMEWRYLLEKFGPFAGRYGIKFPQNWEERLLIGVSTENWQELEKIKVLLRRAQERKSLLNWNTELKYLEHKDWIENLESNPASKIDILKAIVRKKSSAFEIDFDSLELPPTAGERISSDVSSFVRVSEVLLTIGPELYFVDQFLNPLKKDHYDVLVGMFKTAARGAARKIDAWTTERRVEASDQEIRNRLIEIKNQSGFKYPIKLYLVDDTASYYKLHDRWLFTQYGGVGFSQGFQRLSKSRPINVWPMDKQHLEDCWHNLREGNADFSTRCISA
jgi:hypothetical protein